MGNIVEKYLALDLIRWFWIKSRKSSIFVRPFTRLVTVIRVIMADVQRLQKKNSRDRIM